MCSLISYGGVLHLILILVGHPLVEHAMAFRGRKQSKPAAEKKSPVAPWIEQAKASGRLDHVWLTNTVERPSRDFVMCSPFARLAECIEGVAERVIHPEIIGRLRGVTELGSGGFKTVHLVRNFKNKNSFGALNVYTPKLDKKNESEQNAAMEKAEQSANAAKQLMQIFKDEPYVMKLLDASPVVGDSQGQELMEGPHFVTEYSEAGSLLDWLNGGSYTLECFNYVGKQLFAAVKNLHSMGWRHCDIKPPNILIRAFHDVNGLDVRCPEIFLADLDDAKKLAEQCIVATPGYVRGETEEETIAYLRAEGKKDRVEFRKRNEYFAVGVILLDMFFPLSLSKSSIVVKGRTHKKCEWHSGRINHGKNLPSPQHFMKYLTPSSDSWHEICKTPPWTKLASAWGIEKSTYKQAEAALKALPEYKQRLEMIQSLLIDIDTVNLDDIESKLS
eukprot:TRINITY_DN26507_c0_g1_i1.p1 TRINITY_DN26507_c0_g1~~TRINITY_DN26507_c0_g1_i1.p1  ORF type:complete len:446 (-),score=49.45 TRINITY_DN26507_c0_g1_i1:65-1402(-)